MSLTRRAFVQIAGATAGLVALLRSRTAHRRPSGDVREGTLYMSQDARRGTVVPNGFEKRWREPLSNRYSGAREAYIERVNRPLSIATLVALASKRNRRGKPTPYKSPTRLPGEDTSNANVFSDVLNPRGSDKT